MKRLEINIGGVYYLVEVDVDFDYVVKVFSVSVWTEEKYKKIPMSPSDLNKFFELYEDALNECWEETKANEKLYYMETKGELL